jgi:hypothetical protein
MTLLSRLHAVVQRLKHILMTTTRHLLIIIAMGLYPQVENELALSCCPSGVSAVMRAKNKLCEMSQCMIPDVA